MESECIGMLCVTGLHQLALAEAGSCTLNLEAAAQLEGTLCAQ